MMNLPTHILQQRLAALSLKPNKTEAETLAKQTIERELERRKRQDKSLAYFTPKRS